MVGRTGLLKVLRANSILPTVHCTDQAGALQRRTDLQITSADQLCPDRSAVAPLSHHCKDIPALEAWAHSLFLMCGSSNHIPQEQE